MTIRLNPNKEEVAQIRAAIKANDGYCPCSLVKDDSHKCMCCNFKNQTDEGECHCGLYYKSAN